MGEEGGRLCLVAPIGLTKLMFDVALFFFRETCISDDENREHAQSNRRRPLDEKAEHDEHEGAVLGMADFCIRSGRRQAVGTLRVVEHMPRFREQEESGDNKKVARDMNWIKMGASLPTDKCLEQMARIVREEINAGVMASQPAGEKIDRQRKSVHLGKESDNKGGESAEGPPVTLAFGFKEAEGKKDKEERVEDH